MRKLKQPDAIRIKQQEQNHGHRHDVHIKQQNDAAVIEAPPQAQASHRVQCACESDNSGQNQPRVSAVFGKPGPNKGKNQAAQHQQRTAKQRFLAKVQEAWLMDADWKRGGDDFFSLAEADCRGKTASRVVKRHLGVLRLHRLPWSRPSDCPTNLRALT